MNIISRLRVAREEAGMTQADVSRASGIAVPNLSKIESGRVDIRLSTLNRVLDALELEIQFVPRRISVSLDGVADRSQQGREGLAEVGLTASCPQERLDAKRRQGRDVAVEQAILDAGV